jgi:hypothetical protein
MKKVFFFLLIIFVFQISPVGAQKVSSEAFPPDLACAGCITIVIKNEEYKSLRAKDLDRLNDLVEKKLIGVYKGPTVFISPKDLDTNSRYKNEAVYRYILNIKFQPATVSHFDTDARGGSHIHEIDMQFINLQFYDRIEKKGYPDMFERLKSWPQMLDRAAKALNDRLKTK